MANEKRIKSVPGELRIMTWYVEAANLSLMTILNWAILLLVNSM